MSIGNDVGGNRRFNGGVALSVRVALGTARAIGECAARTRCLRAFIGTPCLAGEADCDGEDGRKQRGHERLHRTNCASLGMTKSICVNDARRCES
jgi:hypothetical protein